MTQRRFARVFAQGFREVQRRVDFRIKLRLVIVVIAKRRVNLREGKMGVLELDLFRTPTVGDDIERNFTHLGVRFIDPCDAAVIQTNMRSCGGLHGDERGQNVAARKNRFGGPRTAASVRRKWSEADMSRSPFAWPGPT